MIKGPVNLRVKPVLGYSLVVAFALPTNLMAQRTPISLPQPNGPYPVGTVTYQWEDHTRTFSFSSYEGDFRQVMVQFWYPAQDDSTALLASYSPLSPDYRHVAGHSTVRPAFSNGLRANPLVLISPGRGTERFGYTTIAEALASNGYVVAAVDMPDIGYVTYPDGYIARPNPAFRPSRELMAGPYENVDEFFETPTEMGLEDLELVLRRIHQLNDDDPTGRFTERIDLSRVGIFGHSLGGRIAGALAEKQTSIKAYIAMEGIAPRRARLNGLGMPAAMMVSSGTLPYAIDNYQTLIDGRKNTVFMVELQKFGHNSVTDFPYVTPDQFGYEIDPRVGLITSVTIVQAFFDAYLKQGSGFLESTSDLENVLVTEHAGGMGG